MNIKKLLLLPSIIIAALSAGFLFYFSPILKPLPKPTGPYNIGLAHYFFKNEARNDAFADNSKTKRAIALNLWYPTLQTKGKKTSYLGTKMPYIKKIYAEKTNLPYFISSILLKNLKTHAFKNGEVSNAQASYPVILFSHGLFGEPTEFYSALCENLASHGFIVVGIDHPYFNLITQYPDGRVVTSSKLETAFALMKPQEQFQFQNKAIKIYKKDMSFAIDELEKLNNNPLSIFYKRLDLTKIGVAGHSAGGTAAIEFCRIDNQCKAAADLDGWYDQAIGQDPINKPLLLLFGSKSVEVTEPSQEYLKQKQITREQYFEREQKIADHRKRICGNPECSMIISPGIKHGDFSDLVLLKWPLRNWNEPSAYKVINQINSHLLNFFEAHLKDR
jgi:dienelactone hydrolase